MPAPIRIGFIGCGLIARSHAQGLAAVDCAQIGPVCDIDVDRAQRFATDAGASASVADDINAVVADSDAVYVCTWTAAHPAAVDAVVAAGKPVFCEKPLAVDLPTSEAMTASVTRSGVVNQVGLVLRHSPAFRWLHQRVHEPSAGSTMSIVFRDDQYIPIQGMYQSNWRSDPAKAGAGTLLEHSIHDLDLIRWLLGPIAEISARTEQFHGIDGIEDQATLLLVARSGAHATLTSVWHDVLSRPSQRRVEVFCQHSMLTLTGDWNGPVMTEMADGGTTSLEGQELVSAVAGFDGLGINPDAEFVSAIREQRPSYPDFALALEAHRLADAAYRSAAAGGRPMTL